MRLPKTGCKHFLCVDAFFVLVVFATVCFNVGMTKQLIDQLGGIKAVAEYLSVDRSAVGNWRLAGRSIPWKHRPGIARLAADRAVDLPPGFWGIPS